MSLLSYNGVSLPYSQLTSFETRAVYDDVSKTDQTVLCFDIQIQCLITSDAQDLLDPGGVLLDRSENPADITSGIFERLMEPRKTLSFKFADVELIPGKAGVAGRVDAMNGPKPQSCRFTQMNNTTWMMQYHIIAHYRVNYRVTRTGSVVYTNLPGNVVLYNRWTERVELDASQYTTRNRSGKFMIRSDNDKGEIADQWRTQMAVCSVPQGFIRLHSSYTQTPDGLGLQYEITDQEVFRLPPSPALEADGEYTEEGTRADGIRVGHCRVKLRAPKSVSQYDLVDTAVSVGTGKLDIAGARFTDPTEDNRGVILGCKVTVGLYDNWVVFQMSVQYVYSQKRVQGAAFIKKNIGDLPGSGKTTPIPIYYDRGTAGILLQAAAYYDPDLAGTQLGPDKLPVADNFTTATGKQSAQMNKGKIPGQAGNEPEA